MLISIRHNKLTTRPERSTIQKKGRGRKRERENKKKQKNKKRKSLFDIQIPEKRTPTAVRHDEIFVEWSSFRGLISKVEKERTNIK